LSRRRRLLAAVTCGFVGVLVAPALASACPDTPVLGQACELGQTGLATADAVKENTIDGPLPGARNDAPITGAVGGALGDIAGAVAQPIFDQIAAVTTEAATWVIGQITNLIDATTSPDLLSKGFVSRYTQMAGLAALLASAMLLLAVIEGLARGDMRLLGRAVLINLPLAFIATSAAYVVVQLLLGITDQLSHAMAQSTGEGTERFLHGASEGLSKVGAAGGLAAGPGGAAAGAAGVPVFAVIIAALVTIVGGFFVWMELLMRDAAIYVVALFLPMALAASIWPRWAGALRRTVELLIALIASKFVIVSIISLAAGLLAHNDGRFEHVLAAAALMLLACFSPLVLLKLVPFAEGAMASAYGRRAAAGAVVSGTQLMNSAQMMRSTARANWSGGGGETAAQTQRSGQGRGNHPGSGGSAATTEAGGAGAGVGGASGASAAVAGAAAIPAAGSRAAQVLGSTAAGDPPAPAEAAQRPDSASSRPPREAGREEEGPPAPASEQTPRPPSDFAAKPREEKE
jgi:hypothetical protein